MYLLKVTGGLPLKPGKLDPDERQVLQTHPTAGGEILMGLAEKFPSETGCISLAAELSRSHHERWDGTGYPDRLAKTDIPYLARIVAVADAFDAMTSDRPYHVGRKARPPEEAFAEVEKQSGRQFDPDCAKAFLEIRDQIFKTFVELNNSGIPVIVDPESSKTSRSKSP